MIMKWEEKKEEKKRENILQQESYNVIFYFVLKDEFLTFKDYF